MLNFIYQKSTTPVYISKGLLSACNAELVTPLCPPKNVTYERLEPSLNKLVHNLGQVVQIMTISMIACMFCGWFYWHNFSTGCRAGIYHTVQVKYEHTACVREEQYHRLTLDYLPSPASEHHRWEKHKIHNSKYSSIVSFPCIR